MRNWLRVFLSFLLIQFALVNHSHAGQDCGERSAPTPQALAKGLELGLRVKERLEGSGASAALVARVGLNLSEFGQRYTHMGVAVRDHVRNTWRVMHLFNPCGKAESEIVNQPLERFFEVDLFEYEALVLTPAYAFQAPLRTAFMSPRTAKSLHHPAYNLIAHPFNTRFQNSNQWIVEMLALANAPVGSVRDRSGAQAWLKAQNFEPGSIRVSNTRRSAARLFSAHVSFADHTQEEYEKQTYAVVTVDSIARFVASRDSQLVQDVVR